MRWFVTLLRADSLPYSRAEGYCEVVRMTQNMCFTDSESETGRGLGGLLDEGL
jgi:hypothetical protein